MEDIYNYSICHLSFISLPSSTGIHEPQTLSEEEGKDFLTLGCESGSPPAESGVSPEEPTETHTQEVEDVPAHSLVEVRSCEDARF